MWYACPRRGFRINVPKIKNVLAKPEAKNCKAGNTVVDLFSTKLGTIFIYPDNEP